MLIIVGTMHETGVLKFVEPGVVAAGCAVLMLAAWQIAFRQCRQKQATGEAQESGGVLIDEACLAILGLLLAFTFASAYTKYDNRNAKVADDAGVLRALYHRCDLLPEPWRAELIPLVRQAIGQRLFILRPGFKPADFPALDAQGHDTENRMLVVIKRMSLDKDASSLAGQVADACYAVAASHEARLAAAKDQVPLPVVALLILVASISTFLLGRSQAIVGRIRRTTITLVLMVAAIVYVTLDLESPLRGFIQTDQSPIIRLAESLGITP